MKPFTDTKAGWDRIYRVCEEIRHHLGLGNLVHRFSVSNNTKYPRRLAACWTKTLGWQVHISIYDLFFKHDFGTQYETLVHEHLHALMHPLAQCVENHARKMKPRERKHFDELYEIADEITVEHATKSIANLLWPHVKKVL